MLTQADDEGYLVADAEQFRLQFFGYQRKVREKDVEAALQAIAATGLINLLTHSAGRYANFPSWRDHQKISHPTPSKISPLVTAPECAGIVANVPPGSIDRNDQGSIEGERGKRQEPSAAHLEGAPAARSPSTPDPLKDILKRIATQRGLGSRSEGLPIQRAAASD